MNKTTTVQFIVYRHDDNDTAPQVIDAEDGIHYTFPAEGIVKIVRREITVEDWVIYQSTTKKGATVHNLNTDRKPRKRGPDRKPRKSGYKIPDRGPDHCSTCGAQGRRAQQDGFCRECRPSQSTR